MIQRAFLLRDPLDLYIKRAREKSAEKIPLPQDDELSIHDWNILARTRDLLQPFFDLTQRLQGRASHATYGSIWEVLPSLDFLLGGLEKQNKEYGAQLMEQSAQVTGSTLPPEESAKRSARKAKMPKKAAQKPIKDYDVSDIAHISTCIDSCWAKLRKYYQLLDQSPVYAAAVILNPEHKWDYFKKSW
jgi:hypothetical protein